MLKSINPTTGAVINETRPMDAKAAEAAVERSVTAYRDWRQTTFAQRAEVLQKVAQLLRDDIEALAPLMTDEMGKPIKEARGEIQKAAWCADHYAEHAEAYMSTETLASDATHSYVQYEALGPILGILPWNAPFWLAFRFCAPALMAGNTCLMKHDPHVQACAEAIEDLFRRVGAPANIFQNLPLDTPEIAAVIKDDRVRGVSFTGSEKAGSIVASTATGALKPVVLELGGSDPAIVLADADLEAAADTITLSRIINAGQSCIAAKRVIVEASVYDKMVGLLQERLGRLTMGDPKEDTTDIGPIARDDLRDNLVRQVDTSIKEGARCLLGGKAPDGPGFFFPVTLLADVTQDMTAAREETFGPVAVVMKAADEQEAVAIANDTPYGLAAAVWTSRERGEAIARQLETGQVAVNGIVKTDPRLPSGGIKRSGVGRELGPHGIREFANAKQIWVGPKQG